MGKQLKRWFHAIGVSGKTTANVAKLFKDMGWFVTGSDMQFLPPASIILTENNIETVEGYNFKHLTRDFWENKLGENLDIPNHPDLGLIMSFLSPKNPEYRFAKLKNIKILPYAKILGEYLVKENSIVVIGTAGKTTTTALASKVLINLGLDPSFMIGAEVSGFSESLCNTDTNWSVLEGDEYHSVQLEGHAKFLEYKPKYLIITNIGWEHQDIYPTQESYNEQFRKAVELVPEDGLIIAKFGDKNIDEIVRGAKCRVIRYASKFEIRSFNLSAPGHVKLKTKIKNSHQSKVVSLNFKAQSSELLWTIEKDELESKKFRILNDKNQIVLESETTLLGEYNLENILAVTTLICSLPSHVLPSNLLLQKTKTLNVISQTIREFRGPKKRLEIIYSSDNFVVVDDFGVAPSRAVNSLKTLRETYHDFKIVSVFEPNSASRPKNKEIFTKMYTGVFNSSDLVIIPSLSVFNNDLIEENEMEKFLETMGYDAKAVNSEDLIDYLSNLVNESKLEGEKLLIVFFSSYRLTSIMEKFVEIETRDLKQDYC